MTPEIRLFVALLAGPPEQAALQRLIEPDLVGFRWTPVDQTHLTLRFIGEVPAATAERSETALAGVRVEPFWLDLGGVGRFPPRGAPAVVWAGLSAVHPRLRQLRQQVDDHLLAAGLPLKLPPFVPHLTLARVRDAAANDVAAYLKRHRDFEGPSWPVSAFALMESQRLPAGSRHVVRRLYPLRKD